MAITCKWEHEFGHAIYGEERITMYTGGNCIACICTENKCLMDFICDVDHLKNVLGTDGSHWKTDYSNIHLNGKYPDAWKVAKLLNKFEIATTMYRKEPEKQ